jgi:hypothetical protein
LTLCLVAGAAAWPGATAAQQTDARWARLEFRAGLAGHGASEIGLHQVPERYLALNEDVTVADELYWEPMWRLAFSLPIIR